MFWRIIAGFALAYLLLARKPAMVNFVMDASSYCDRVAERLSMSGASVVRLDFLKPVTATICEYINTKGITRYYVDPRAYDNDGGAFNRMVETCWPRRHTDAAADKFYASSDLANASPELKGCQQTPLENGVVHVSCGR